MTCSEKRDHSGYFLKIEFLAWIDSSVCTESNGASFIKKLELCTCRAHTPRAHCAIYRVAFVHVHGYNFVIVNFRNLVEVLLNCIYVATGGDGDKKHSL